jgi:hypothetical protein
MSSRSLSAILSPVPKQLWTPTILLSKENLDQADFRGVRAPEGWKPSVRS